MVADLLMHGVEKIEASCLRCGESWDAPITMLPSATTLAKIQELMICPACGGRNVGVTPVWPGDAPKTN
ncbi:hypothetical protein [Rhodoblastus sp.]|uniref:hypothetical protein n=1 Tax=Rhodoblastus sp. TaxID=1962975 RepID=UPI003F9BDE0A